MSRRTPTAAALPMLGAVLALVASCRHRQLDVPGHDGRRLALSAAPAAELASSAAAASSVTLQSPAIRLRGPQDGSLSTCNSVLFAWTPEAPGRLQLARDRAFNQPERETTGAGSATIRGLPIGTWFWRVVATGDGQPSPVWRFRIAGQCSRTVRHGLLVGSDIDGDGNSDLLLQQGILFGQRDMQPAQTPLWLTDTGLPPCASVRNGTSTDGVCRIYRPNGVGDVNGDGFDDLVFLRDGALSLLLGGQNRSAPRPERLCTAARHCLGEGTAWRLGDVDADGFADVALLLNAQEHGADSVGVFHGSVEGIRGEPAMELREVEEIAGGGDLDGDGFDDVFVLRTDGRIMFHRGRPTGLVPSSDAEIALPGAARNDEGPRPWPVINMVDINADGLADAVLVASPANHRNRPELTTLSGTEGAPGFERRASVSWPYRDCCNESFAWTPIHRVDARGPSLVVADRGNWAKELLVVRGRTDGALVLPHVPPARIDAMTMFSRQVEAVGDVNGDGFDDLLMLNYADVDGSSFFHLISGSLTPFGRPIRGREWHQSPDGLLDDRGTFRF